MQDRFKFRVWNNEHKRYIEDNCYPIGGDYSLSMTQHGYVEVIGLGDYQDYSDDIHSWGVVKNLEDYIGDCVVEQCTGLKDKNGKLIYDGDYIRAVNQDTKDRPDLQVGHIWVDEMGCRWIKFKTEELSWNDFCSLIDYDATLEIEVIGNEHEERNFEQI